MNDIHIHIEAQKCENYRPIERFHIMEDTDFEDIKDGICGWYNLIITSSRGDDTAQHILQGQLLSHDESEMIEELDELLQDELGEKIAIYWKLHDVEDGPYWKRP